MNLKWRKKKTRILLIFRGRELSSQAMKNCFSCKKVSRENRWEFFVFCFLFCLGFFGARKPIFFRHAQITLPVWGLLKIFIYLFYFILFYLFVILFVYKPYNTNYTDKVWKNSSFSLERLNSIWPIAIHAYPMCTLTSFLMMRYCYRCMWSSLLILEALDYNNKYQ